MTLEANGPNGAAPEAQTRIAVITLGMHRSGTSALSGVLARLGCDTPATPMPVDSYNTKGFFESGPISSLNNVILSSAGTSWDDWTEVNSAWFDSPRRAAFTDQACNLVKDEFGPSPLIVLKDPRISLLVPLWIDVLRRENYTPKVAFAYRGASDVAASLQKRNGFDPALGRLLWLRYVLEAEHGSRDVPRVFASYDRLLADWTTEISRIETGLDLRLPRQSLLANEEVEDFLTPSMRHHTTGTAAREIDTASHSWIRDAHAVFDRWTREGEDPEDRKTLDRIRAEFDDAVPAFDRLVRLAKGRAGSESGLKAQLAQAEEALAEKTRLEGQAQEALSRADARLAQTEGALSEKTRLEGQAREALSRAEACGATLKRAAEEAKSEIASLQAETERRGEVLLNYEQKIDDLNHMLAEASKLQIDLQRNFEAAEQAATKQSKSNATQLRAAKDTARIQKRESDAELAHVHSEIERILNSKSFKVTAPLRHLRSLLAKN